MQNLQVSIVALSAGQTTKQKSAQIAEQWKQWKTLSQACLSLSHHGL
jgi:hypothetical protein